MDLHFILPAIVIGLGAFGWIAKWSYARKLKRSATNSNCPRSDIGRRMDNAEYRIEGLEKFQHKVENERRQG